MLVAVADRANAYDIAEELSQYIRDSDEALARCAIRAVAAVALKVPEVDGILDRLLLFLGYGKDYVTAETLIQLALVLRRYRAAADACLDAVMDIDPASLGGEPEREALVWILGEFGERVQAAPYVLEGLVEGEAPEEGEQAAAFVREALAVRLALRAAVAKLFFTRPPEMGRALGLVLAAAAADPSVQVRDRARLTSRLIAHDAQAAERVLCAPLPLVDADNLGDGLSAEARDTVFDELNTLSVVYRAPAATFIGATPSHAPNGEGEDDELDVGGDMATGLAAAAGADEGLLLDLEDSVSEAGTDTRPASQPGSGPQPSSEQDLLSLGNLDSVYSPPPAMAQPAQVATGPLDALLDMGAGTEATNAPSSFAAAPAALGGGLDDLLGGLDLGGGGPAPASVPNVTDAASFEAAWNSLGSASGVVGRQSLPLGALTSVQSRGFQDFVDHVGQAGFVCVRRPMPGGATPLLFSLSTSRGLLASVRVAQQASAVAVKTEVRAGTRADAVEGLESLQNLLLCL